MMAQPTTLQKSHEGVHEVATAPNPAEAESRLQLVTFELGDEEYGIDILQVQEIMRMMAITRVPQSPPGVEGVVNLRGQIMPVMDLRKRFNLEPQKYTGDSRIVVVEIHDRVIGVIVDRVNEVLEVNASAVEATPAMARRINNGYVQGVVKHEERLLILLYLDRLLRAKEINNLDQDVNTKV